MKTRKIAPLKETTLSIQLRQALKTCSVGSVILASGMGVAHANGVIGFGETAAVNGADPAYVETEGGYDLGVKIPASETVVTVSGYVRGDFRFDDSSDLGDSFVVSSIPADGTPGDAESGHTRLHARQSRLRVRSNTELDNGTTLKTHFEGDFFGTGGNESFSNSASFRLRHAYATYGGLTIGQVWTNFMDFVAYPTTVDFFGPAGKSFARQAVIKYTFSNGISISAENPETDGFGALGRVRESTGGPGQDVAPDFTIAWRGGPGGAGGSYEFAGVGRLLGVDGVIEGPAGGPGIDVDETEFGFGVNLAGAWAFGPFSVAGSLTFGDGIGRYIINGAGNEIFVTDTGEVETVTSMAFSGNVKYNWTPGSSSLIAVGAFENDDPSQSNGIDNLQTIHVNYIWTPFPGSSFGVELIQGFLENADGSEGDATRFAFGAQLNF